MGCRSQHDKRTSLAKSVCLSGATDVVRAPTRVKIRPRTMRPCIVSEPARFRQEYCIQYPRSLETSEIPLAMAKEQLVNERAEEYGHGKCGEPLISWRHRRTCPSVLLAFIQLLQHHTWDRLSISESHVAEATITASVCQD